jgi:hypothetical protein
VLTGGRTYRCSNVRELPHRQIADTQLPTLLILCSSIVLSIPSVRIKNG